MSRWYCEECDHFQPSNPSTCDRCGHPILEPAGVHEDGPEQSQDNRFWAAVALGLALVLGFAVGLVMYLSVV